MCAAEGGDAAALFILQSGAPPSGLTSGAPPYFRMRRGLVSRSNGISDVLIDSRRSFNVFRVLVSVCDYEDTGGSTPFRSAADPIRESPLSMSKILRDTCPDTQRLGC